jgi:hypothetical protein
MDKKVYCFDLDNTLCYTEGSNYAESKPIESRIKRVNELYDEGHTIIIETARGNHSGKNWWYLTNDQLKSWGLKYHTLRTGIKWNADIFVDDRAINDKDFFDKAKFNESGSGVNTKLILVNRVRKEATNERMEKLLDEINFIKDIPEEFKDHFPEIVLYGQEEKTSFYEMKHYNLPSLRRLIFNGDLTIDQILYWIEKVTKFSIDLYKHEIIETPNDYVKTIHWDRFWNRKKELESKSSIFRKIFSNDTIEINGKILKNSHVIVKELEKHQDKFLPEFVGRWSHSDLHFSNILIDLENDNFICIDPRGYNYCDPYYDFGKLWHSVNGKYEMVANDMWIINENSYQLNQNRYFDLLEELKAIIPEKIFFNYSKESKEECMMKIEFNEAMHFITLVPFQLIHDEKEERAKVAYFIGTELLNNFYNKYFSND